MRDYFIDAIFQGKYFDIQSNDDITMAEESPVRNTYDDVSDIVDDAKSHFASLL